MLAAGADKIIRLRMQRLRPAEPVVITTGPGSVAEWTVRASCARSLDWRWVVGLDVVVAAHGVDDVAPLLRAIDRHRPATVVLWYPEVEAAYDVIVEAGGELDLQRIPAWDTGWLRAITPERRLAA